MTNIKNDILEEVVEDKLEEEVVEEVVEDPVFTYKYNQSTKNLMVYYGDDKYSFGLSVYQLYKYQKNTGRDLLQEIIGMEQAENPGERMSASLMMDVVFNFANTTLTEEDYFMSMDMSLLIIIFYTIAQYLSGDTVSTSTKKK